MNPDFEEFNPLANIEYDNCLNLLGCSSDDFLSYSGVDYPLVTLFDQCWMAEDLKALQFANGDMLLSIADPNEWSSASSQGLPALSEYVEFNYNYTGRILYNGFAVMDERGLCPTGWSLAGDEEWQELELALGLPDALLNCDAFEGCSDGSYSRGSGINLSGFFFGSCDAHIGFDAQIGSRDSYGYFNDYSSDHWTPNVDGVLVSREIYSNCFGGVDRYADGYYPEAGQGRSIRCVRD